MKCRAIFSNCEVIETKCKKVLGKAVSNIISDGCRKLVIIEIDGIKKIDRRDTIEWEM